MTNGFIVCVRPVEFVIKVGLNRGTLLLFIVFIKNFKISNITFNNMFFRGKKSIYYFFSFLEKWVFLNKLSPLLKLEIIRDENENFKK